MPNATRITLTNVALSYPFVNDPQQNDRGLWQYSATFVLPKGSDNAAKIKAAIKAALEQNKLDESFLKENGGNYDSPLHTGRAALADKNDPTKFRLDPAVYEGWIAARTPGKATPDEAKIHRPGIANGIPALLSEAERRDASIIYPGVIVNATISFYTYANKKSGVGVGLNNIQRVKDGPRLDNRVAATDDFATVASLDDLDALMK